MITKKGYYRHKEDKNHIVNVYDITFCVSDDKRYYSYTDPLFDCRYLSSPQDIFLEQFEYSNSLNKKIVGG